MTSVLAALLAVLLAALPVADSSRVTSRDVLAAPTAEPGDRTAAAGSPAEEEASNRTAEANSSMAEMGNHITVARQGLQRAQSSMEAASSHGQKEAGSAVSHEEPTSDLDLDHIVQKLIQDSGTNTGDSCWVQDRVRMGCKASCQCGWFEQCYPKFISVVKDDFKQHRTANVGVCGTAMLSMVMISIVLFILLLSGVVTVRMYFQWREGVTAAEYCENTDRTKSLLMPSSSTSIFPPAEKAAAEGLPVSEHISPIHWPEAEDVK